MHNSRQRTIALRTTRQRVRWLTMLVAARYSPHVRLIAVIATNSGKVSTESLFVTASLTYIRERIYNSAHSVACPWPYAPHPIPGTWSGADFCLSAASRRSTADRSRVLAFWSQLLRVRRKGHIACREMQLASDVFVLCFLVSLTVCRRRTRLRGVAAPGIPLIATWGHL